MKFYYKNKLIRTSKTRNYKYAVIVEQDDTIKVFSCHSTLELANKAFAERKKEAWETALSNFYFFFKSDENKEFCRKLYGDDYDPKELYDREKEYANCIKIVEIYGEQ